MKSLKSTDYHFNIKKVGTAGALAKGRYLSVTREFTACKMGVTDRGIDVFRNLVTGTNINGMPDKVSAPSISITIKTWIWDGAVIAIKKIVKAIRTAGKPEPAVTAVYTQIRRRLKLKLDLGRLDVLKNDVIVADQGRAKPKNRSKRLFTSSLGCRSPLAYP